MARSAYALVPWDLERLTFIVVPDGDHTICRLLVPESREELEERRRELLSVDPAPFVYRTRATVDVLGYPFTIPTLGWRGVIYGDKERLREALSLFEMAVLVLAWVAGLATLPGAHKQEAAPPPAARPRGIRW